MKVFVSYSHSHGFCFDLHCRCKVEGFSVWFMFVPWRCLTMSWPWNTVPMASYWQWLSLILLWRYFIKIVLSFSYRYMDIKYVYSFHMAIAIFNSPQASSSFFGHLRGLKVDSNLLGRQERENLGAWFRRLPQINICPRRECHASCFRERIPLLLDRGKGQDAEILGWRQGLYGPYLFRRAAPWLPILVRRYTKVGRPSWWNLGFGFESSWKLCCYCFSRQVDTSLGKARRTGKTKKYLELMHKVTNHF